MSPVVSKENSNNSKLEHRKDEQKNIFMSRVIFTYGLTGEKTLPYLACSCLNINLEDPRPPTRIMFWVEIKQLVTPPHASLHKIEGNGE